MRFKNHFRQEMHSRRILDSLSSPLLQLQQHSISQLVTAPALRGLWLSKGAAFYFSDGTYQTMPTLRGGSASWIHFSAGLSWDISTQPSPSGHVMTTGNSFFEEKRNASLHGNQAEWERKNSQPLSTLYLKEKVASYYYSLGVTLLLVRHSRSASICDAAEAQPPAREAPMQAGGGGKRPRSEAAASVPALSSLPTASIPLALPQTQISWRVSAHLVPRGCTQHEPWHTAGQRGAWGKSSSPQQQPLFMSQTLLPSSALHCWNQGETVHGNLCRISGKLHRLRLLSIAEPIYVRWQYLGGAAGTGCTALPVQPVALTVKKLNSNSSGIKQLINILKSQACSNVKPNLLH